jgi:hypothetical protein
MATHHVRLRRAWLAPVGQLTVSPGERGSETYTTTQAQRAMSKMRSCVSPRERRSVERPMSSEDWQGARVLHSHSRTRARNRQEGMGHSSPA